MMRLFVAIALPKDIRENVQRVQTYLRTQIGDEGIRWTPPEQFHFTLKFLGDVDASDLPPVTAGVAQAAARSTPWELEAGGIGVFPQQRSPQVLWIGATNGVPVLTQTAQYMNEELAKQGFPAESRPYVPHLTLARMKTRDGEETVARVLPTVQNALELRGALGAFPVQECVLMNSELRPEGIRYTPVQTFAFGGRIEYNR